MVSVLYVFPPKPAWISSLPFCQKPLYIGKSFLFYRYLSLFLLSFYFGTTAAIGPGPSHVRGF